MRIHQHTLHRLQRGVIIKEFTFESRNLIIDQKGLFFSKTNIVKNNETNNNTAGIPVLISFRYISLINYAIYEICDTNDNY